ncbi:unnamed protein product [Choristocarpus tenellus]
MKFWLSCLLGDVNIFVPGAPFHNVYILLPSKIFGGGNMSFKTRGILFVSVCTRKMVIGTITMGVGSAHTNIYPPQVVVPPPSHVTSINLLCDDAQISNFKFLTILK